MTIIVLGSINADITTYGKTLPRIGETIFAGRCEIDLGGKGANQAAAAARLGAEIELIGRVGSDAFGRLVMEQLQGFAVSTRHVVRDLERGTGVAIINVDADGRNAITVVSGANMRVDEAQWNSAGSSVSGAKVLMLQLETPLATNQAAAREARRRGIRVILDPAPAPQAGLPADLYPLLDVITPNETETRALIGFEPITIADAAHAARELVGKGARAAIVTLGERGAYLVGEGCDEQIAAFAVTPVSTVAAGDCFNAGLAVALAEGKPLVEAARFASACAALSTTRPGAAASAPTREEVVALLTRS